jgi:hypothetical protein
MCCFATNLTCTDINLMQERCVTEYLNFIGRNSMKRPYQSHIFLNYSIYKRKINALCKTTSVMILSPALQMAIAFARYLYSVGCG